jgi:hypothetical protein
MSITADSNTATPDPALPDSRLATTAFAETVPEDAVELALAAAIKDASRIGDLLDVLRGARLWLPLPADGAAAINGTAVTLPTVCYLGSDFVPAYSSAQLLQRLARPADLPAAEHLAPEHPAHPDDAEHPASPADLAGGASATDQARTLPHVVVRAADLARLLPPTVGIALNAGASESVPVYPQGVSYLAAENAADELARISVGPLPVRPDALLAEIAAGLMQIAQVRDASAGWLSVQFAGEGLLISVTLDDPADAAARDLAVGAIERAAWQARAEDVRFPIDVTFPGEAEPDHIDEWIAAFATPFYRRA